MMFQIPNKMTGNSSYDTYCVVNNRIAQKGVLFGGAMVMTTFANIDSRRLSRAPEKST